ncbi:hypothetical protein [Burkholderia anthina]|uniref:hypothetical protein n=1 Tax=Burkholderia anthina TaxID=179879 RepID=UPI0037BED02B
MTTTTQQTSTTIDPAQFLAPQANLKAGERNHGTHPYAVEREEEIVTTLIAVPADDPKGKGFRFQGAREFKRLMQPGTIYLFRLIEGLCRDEGLLTYVTSDNVDVFFMMAGVGYAEEHKSMVFGLCTMGLDLWSAYVAVDYRKVQMVPGTWADHAARVYAATVQDSVPDLVRDCIDFDALGKKLHNAGEIHAFTYYREPFVIVNARDFRD